MARRRFITLFIISILVLAVLSFQWDGPVHSVDHSPKAQSAPAAPPVPSYGPVIFSSDFDDQTSQPRNPGNLFPASTVKVYAYWAYSSVQEGSPFKFEWRHDGKYLSGNEVKFNNAAGFAWQWASSPDSSPLQPGIYEIVIKVGEQVVLSAPCVVQGGSQPAFSSVSFGSDFDNRAQQPANNARSFTAGLHRLYAQWAYSGVEQLSPFSYEWLLNGKHFSGGDATFNYPSGLTWLWAALPDEAPLKSGTYKIVIKAGGKVLVSGQAVIESPVQARFGPLTFSSDFNEQAERPVNIGKAFDSGITRLYAYWPYTGVDSDTIFRCDWLLNGELFTTGELRFTASSGYVWLWANLEDSTPLSPGIYQLIIRVADQVVAYDQCVIREGAARQLNFGPMSFSTDFDWGKNKAIGVGKKFKQGPNSLYACWTTDGIKEGDAYTVDWFLNGVPYSPGLGTFGAPPGPACQPIALSVGEALPLGTYQVFIKMGGETVEYGECVIEK